MRHALDSDPVHAIDVVLAQCCLSPVACESQGHCWSQVVIRVGAAGEGSRGAWRSGPLAGRGTLAVVLPECTARSLGLGGPGLPAFIGWSFPVRWSFPVGTGRSLPGRKSLRGSCCCRVL